MTSVSQSIRCPKEQGSVMEQLLQNTLDLVGRTIASHVLTERIGAGLTGAVYSGRHEDTEALAVVHLLHPMVAERAEVVRWLERAAEAGALDHPSAVRVLDHGRDEATGLCYLVREHVEGESLDQRLRSGERFDVDSVSALVHDVAGLLSASHSRDIVHGDLRPANLIIQPGGRVRVIGLGLVPPHLPVGIPPYRAPELSLGRSDVDQRVDVYALGVIAYELLTGIPLFVDHDGADVGARQLNTDPAGFGELGIPLPNKVGSTVTRALARSPDDRLASVTELAQAFPLAGGDAAGTAAGEAGESDRPSPEHRSDGSEPVPRLRFLSVLPSLVAFAIIGYLGWYVATTPEPEDHGPVARATFPPRWRSPYPAARLLGEVDASLSPDAGVVASLKQPEKAPSRAAPATQGPRRRVVARRAQAPAAATVASAAEPKDDVRRKAVEPTEVARTDAADRGSAPKAGDAAGPGPKAGTALTAKMWALQRGGEHLKAYWVARTRLHDDPTDKQAIQVLGLAACALKRTEGAEEAYKSLDGTQRKRVARACLTQGIKLGN